MNFRANLVIFADKMGFFFFCIILNYG